ncbi:MAG: TonB-dependent receptor [Bacteroidales bacterium]|nr:TonB-dependent receptor [Bacteroidales bacterium]
MKKIKKTIYFLTILIFINNCIYAQRISGHVVEKDAHNNHNPLPGVNVYWLNTTDGIATDIDGHFEIEKKNENHKFLVFSYVGYLNDTIEISGNMDHLHVVLEATLLLNETVIEARGSGTHVQRINPIYTEQITSNEIQKAACCNLSESFETNASVDVSYSDAVSGAKQIQLLGLSGIYSQLLTENIPSVRGPAIPYGLLYVPGPWMESIQISKGTSSVINGYESITGQINVEYKKPQNSEKLFVNMYGNDLGKVESSITTAHKISNNWHTLFLFHGEFQNKPSDSNNDGFMDHPLVKKYNFFNRFSYENHGKMESVFGYKILDEERNAGQINLTGMAPENLYKVKIKTKRYEAFAKNGFFFHNRPGTSLGTIVSGTFHDQQSDFGNRKYNVTHKNLYLNIIYETNLINEKHKFNVGPSFSYDIFNENINALEQINEEIIPGFFAQYTFNNQNNLTAIAGIRYDYNNLYGHIITPRLHVKYNLNEHLTIRASGGKGYRSAHVVAENPFLLMNSRIMTFDENIKMEEAFNYGTAITYDFSIIGKESNISIDFFRTDFVNQVIIDMERNPSEIHVYNLNGLSYSNSFQAVFTSEILSGLDFTSAFRWNDVKTTMNNKLLAKPFVNNYKGLLSLSYLTQNNKWQFDFTSQFNGKSRLPDTSQLPTEFQKPDYSPAYTVLMGQITFKVKKFEFYFGGENLTSFVQQHPIVNASEPFGDYFDTSFIWGPISPRMFYAGLRFSL